MADVATSPEDILGGLAGGVTLEDVLSTLVATLTES